MSQKEDQPGDLPPDFEALLRPMIEFWSSCCEQAAGGPRAAPEGDSKPTSDEPSASSSVWRRSWLDAASRSMEAYLRSPMFLETMKQHIDALIQAKLGGRAPAPPPPAEPPAGEAGADPLVQRLEALQHELSGKLSGVEQRLQEIERRLPEGEAGPAAGGEPPPGEPGDVRSP